MTIKTEGFLYLIAFTLCIPAANWMLGNVGTVCPPDGLVDFAVYTPLQERRLILAVVASSMVGLVVDSMVFLYLAFGSLDFIAGQIVGKSWMVLLAIPVIWMIRESDTRRGITAVA